MSSSPKPSDAVVADPLAEALDRLEKSMSGNAAPPSPAKAQQRAAGATAAGLPARRANGQEPKSLIPDGMKQGVAVPQKTVSPKTEPNGESAREREPRPLQSPPQQAPKPQANVARALQREVAPAAAPPNPPTQRTQQVEPGVNIGNRTAPSPATSRTAPSPRVEQRPEPAPPVARKPAEARPAAEPARVAPVPVPEIVSGDDEIVPIRRDVPEAIPTARRTGNRRAGGSGVWKAIFLTSFLQLAVLAAVATFLWPKFREGIIREAGAAVHGGSEASEQLNLRVDQSEQKLGAFTGELDAMRKQLSVTPGDAWKEVEYMAARNRLGELADQAIQNADRDAFDKLGALAVESPDEKLRDGAGVELRRVRSAYEMGVRSAGHTIPVGQLFPSLRDKREQELSSEQLVKVLGDPAVRSQYRTKSAYLLADRRSGRAADALARAVMTDKNLDVVREAAMTFREMTGYRTNDLLDAKALGEWWQTNAARVKAVLGG